MLDSAFEYFRFVEIYTVSLIASRIWIPANAGIQKKDWIPPYQVRGRLSQARNDKLLRTYVVMHRMRP